MTDQPVWAIDVGETAIKAVKMRRRGTVAEILEVDMIDFERNLLDEEPDEEDRNQVVRQALVELAQRRNLSGATVIAAIPGRLTISKSVELPPTVKSKIPEMVRFEVQNVIPFPIEEIIWDYVVVSDASTAGAKIDVNLLATKKESVYSFLANFQAAKIDVHILQTAPLALYNLVRADQFPDENVVAVDIGAATTDLVIIDHNNYWVRNVPKAGNRLTDAIQQSFDISFQEAERFKTEATTAAQLKQVSETTRPILRDLVGEISRTIGFYKSQAKDATFDRILFLGNTTRAAGFKTFMSSSLPYEVDFFTTLRNVRVSKKVPLDVFRANLPAFGVALGLGLQAVGLAPNRVNLMPQERAERKKVYLHRGLVAAAVACIMVGTAVMVGGRRAQATTTQETLAQKKELDNKLTSRGELLRPIKEAEVGLEALTEPFMDRNLNVQALDVVQRLVARHNKELADGSPRLYLSAMTFKTKARLAGESKVTVCSIRIAAPGHNANAAKAIVDRSILKASDRDGVIGLRQCQLTLRSPDGQPRVLPLPADPVYKSGDETRGANGFRYPLFLDPFAPQSEGDVKGVLMSKTPYFLWEVTWELKSTVKKRSTILPPKEGDKP